MSNDDKVSENIEVLMAEFMLATDEYVTASQRSRVADTEKIAASNRLDQAQDAIDDWHKAMQKQAPHDSNWHRQRRRLEIDAQG